MNASYTLQKRDPTGGGLGGTLAEGLKIEPQYEQALMSFLGPWAFGLIAKDNEAIMTAIDHLKKEQLGQSLFFRYARGAAPKATAKQGRSPKGHRQGQGRRQRAQVGSKRQLTLCSATFSSLPTYAPRLTWRRSIPTSYSLARKVTWYRVERS